ncbi:hypothetical protein BJF85_15530 [Saccharomonospora sp. CUA-673]|uniref:AfsR/SARP family transcriptional regulator n=1 Tax=Saccharomonospora sp. CUA-673 TaxID=1904969 RepID=UPI00096A060D|nr:BTAD domain-containing putative transcriptional regulator [Saccharomonospora sp. CUA-673]OLT47577.1 hypothetical protein BJF85_15530 [Saccharomonospora sp. CUA-673]
MRIEVLGAVRLADGTGAPVDVPERKVRALLAALTLSRGETVPADVLVERMWGAQLPANPQRVLQAKLSQLRSLFDAAVDGGRDLVAREPGGYRLIGGGSGVTADVDADELHRRVAQAQDVAGADERLAALDGVDRLWRGRPYGEFADELWAAAEVAALEELHLEAVELRASALLEAGRPGDAYVAVQPLLAAHPTREGLVATAMHAAYLTRRQPESFSLYERLRTHLADTLGIDPDPRTRELYQQILRQSPDLNRRGPDRPRASQADTGDNTDRGASSDDLPRDNNLPRHRSVLLGRDEETAEALGLLDDRRLVTVLGLGGVGKTRFATAVTSRALRERSDVDSAWFVDLTVLSAADPGSATSDAIVAALSATMGLARVRGGRTDPIERVAAALDERRALVVLDNCEHVVDAVAAFTADVLAGTDHVRVLATSREPLNLPEEQRLPLHPLAVDDGPDGYGPAVALFLDRTRTVAPHLELGEADVDAATELCRRLDGLPLAIELAAGRMNLLSAGDLLTRITDRLDLFARPGRGAPRRQQTLRGMLDWSWELLDDAERALLRRLAVHPASWTLDAIEETCADPAGEDVPLRRVDVLPVLARLVDRSLVATTHTAGAEGAAVRYRLLETVATYADEQLETSGERRDVAARHVEYFRAMAECAGEHLFGPHARDWVAWLHREHAHLDHALREALRAENGAEAVRLALASFWFRWMTGRTDDLVAELVAVAACPGPRDAAYAQVAVLAATSFDGDGDVPRHPSELLEAHTSWPLVIDPGGGADAGARDAVPVRPSAERTRRWCERVLEALGRFADDAAGVAARVRVQWFAATPLVCSAEFRERGERLFDEAVEYLIADGDVRAAAFAVTQRDWFLVEHWGVRPRGLPDGYDAEAILRAHGDDYGLTQLLAVAHLVAESDGDVERAAAVAAEAHALSEDLDLPGESAYWEVVLALQALRADDLDLCARRLDRATTLARQIGFGFPTVLAHGGHAALALRRGDRARSEALLEELGLPDRVVARRGVTRVLGDDALPAPDRVR